MRCKWIFSQKFKIAAGEKIYVDYRNYNEKGVSRRHFEFCVKNRVALHAKASRMFKKF